MKNLIQFLFLIISTTFLLLSCQSKPVLTEQIPLSAEPSEEIILLEDQVKNGINQQWDVLSPENFHDAQKTFNKAKKMQMSGKTDATVLSLIAISKGWLQEAEMTSQKTEKVFDGLKDYRAGALRAGAPRVLESDWKNLERKLIEFTSQIEKGGKEPSMQKRKELVQSYANLEIEAATKTFLAFANENIKMGTRNDASKLAPKSLNLARLKYENAKRIIQSNPRNLEAIEKAVQDANQESNHLLGVLEKVKAGNTENLVLLAERQQRQIASLKKASVSQQNQLKASQVKLIESEKIQRDLQRVRDLEKHAAHLREHFSPNEAEIKTEGKDLRIRLNAIRFPSGAASLNNKSKSVIRKIDDALKDLPSKKIIIEGHSDSKELATFGEPLAERRALAVRNYLSKLKNIDLKKLETQANGLKKPLQREKNAKERASNRGVEILIKTE